MRMYYRQKLRNELGIPLNAKILLSVGELNENKNHQIVIHTIGKLKRKEVHYVVVGQGKLFENLKVLAEDLKVTEQVHLLGYRDDMTEIYHAADIFVFPSKREGLSVALMEAIACRIPVICSNIRGNIDLIKNSQCFFSPEDRESLIRCVKWVCTKENESKILEEFKQTAEENYRNLEKYDLENVLKKVEELYGNNIKK